ncbi:Nestin [Bagarius yarrelli]|uniref:Nestin n=1 Tax=Bagarius yarrelli TaxID=175774 RepID=A0A556TQ06_BAGYA|nr:Nestin [Bagarius yarrelli]
MEISSARHPVSYAGAEKYEMLELNRRLESYLNHVKLLEEENQLLWKEIEAMRKNQNTGGQRKAQEEALSLARKEVSIAWREKARVEFEVSIMLEEIEELNKLRQKEKSAQVEAARKLAESRNVLEEEKRLQIWLQKQAAYLENEISLQVQVHQEDLAALKSSCAFSKPVLMAPQHTQSLNLQGLGEEYSQRAAQAWQEAASMYQMKMTTLEESLDQTRAHMTLMKQEKKESQLQVSKLTKELESTKAKRELLEKNMVQQRQRQNQDLQYLQAHVEALEAEKLDLGEQIGELLVESRDLLQTKMSLNLEVANYSRPLNVTSRSITHKTNLMTSSPTKTPRSPPEMPKRPQITKEEDVIVRVEKQKLETSANIAKNLNGEGPHDHYRDEEEAKSTDSVSSSSKLPNTVNEPEPILNQIVEEDLQEVFKAELEQALFSTNESAMITSPAEHPQSPESISSNLHIEEAKISEDGDEEETEVSTEMAQISHAPVSAWEDNETVITEGKDVVSEQESESENIAENCTEFKMDSDHAELQLLGENTNTPASLLLQEIPHLSADTFSPFEDDSEILTWADVKEDVIHFIEEESIKSAPELEKEAVKEAGEVEQKLEVGEAEWPCVEVLEGHEFDVNVQEEEHEAVQEEEHEAVQEEEHEAVQEEEHEAVQEEEHEAVQEEEHETVQEKNVEQNIEDTLAYVEKKKMMEEEIEETFGEQKAAVMMSKYEKVNLVGENAEALIDTDEKGNLEGEEAKAVMNTFDKDQNAEEEQRLSEGDESLNISASLRTDPGEADTYAEENTLADTRPLIHYKSDEDTDANIPISQPGGGEATNSEKESEKPEGGSHWNEIIAKRFDTMEDLSEEPELGSMDDIDTEESVQTVLRESIDEEFVALNESGDMDSHFKTVTDDGLVDQLESGLRNNSNENSQGEEEETEIENYHLSTFLVEQQQESLRLFNSSEPSEIDEEQILLTASSNISKDPITENKNNAEKLHGESVEINPEGENQDEKKLNTLLPETSQEQAPAEEFNEEVSTQITSFDEPLNETEEPVCPKEDDVQSNLSEITESDFTDELSAQCHPENQDNTNDLDVEEPNSSEDESSNASQCSQLLSQSEALEQDNTTTMDVVPNPDFSFTGFVSGVLTKESSEDCKDFPAEELEYKEEQQHSVDSSSGEMAEKWENLGHDITSTSHSTSSNAEKLGDVEIENNKENMKVFQGDLPKEDEFQTNEKENDQHTFFSSSIKEGIWTAANFEMAATYDPNDQKETERYSDNSNEPDQTMTFGKDWEDLKQLPPTSSKPEKNIGTSTTQSTEELEQEQTKQLECGDVKHRDEENVHAVDSTDEGDSWSSGEEE